MSTPTKDFARQVVCLTILLALMASLALTPESQAAPAIRRGEQQNPGTPEQALRLSQELGLDLQLVTTLLDAGIPPEDVSRELAAEWPAHLRRLAEREARHRARPGTQGSVPPEHESPPAPLTQSEPDEVQRLWLEIESAYHNGDTQLVANLVGQLPKSEWIAAARLLREVLPNADRPTINRAEPISQQDEERLTIEADAHRAALEQAEAASRAIALATGLDPEKLATPAGAEDKEGGEAILTVGDSCTYATLQAAVNAASSGDTIRVQGRTYTGAAATVNINAKSLSIYGGYNSTCTAQGTTQTVMDATGVADTVFEIYGGAGPLTVYIDNFELTGGTDDLDDGGGIEIDNQFTVTLNRTFVHDNRSDNGGAVHMSASTVLNVQNSSLLYLNSALTGNGGGIYCIGGAITVSDDSYVGFWLFASLGNTALTGSALELYDSVVDLRNSRISGNIATGINDSAVHVYDVGGAGPTSTFDALHNTFAGNTNSAVYYAAGTNGAFNNNIVWGNGHVGLITPRATAACNDTQGGALPGAGNISLDPDFITTLRGGYHLAPGSPAMDACAAGASPDLDNVSRPKGAAYDMGTFELWCASGITDVNGSGAVNIVDIQLVASDWNDLAYLSSHDIDWRCGCRRHHRGGGRLGALDANPSGVRPEGSAPNAGYAAPAGLFKSPLECHPFGGLRAGSERVITVDCKPCDEQIKLIIPFSAEKASEGSLWWSLGRPRSFAG